MGKVAIITGAASGIGEATARLFVEHGACVIVADIQDELGCKVVASIGENKASYKHCDVSNEKQMEETVAYAVEKYGTLDVMFSNAGVIGRMHSILDMDIEDYDKTMAINARGTALAIKQASRFMVERKIRGSIICTASIEATLAGGAPVPYITSKHAVVGLVKSAAIELGKYGIRVNCISPYGISTTLVCNAYQMDKEQLDGQLSANTNLKGQLLKTKHVAEAALFLASNESAYISAHNLAVDGGISSRLMMNN